MLHVCLLTASGRGRRRNPIILAVGPFVGLYPVASKTVAMFKSPHTGNVSKSHAGRRSTVAIRLARYGAIVIKGTSTVPVYLQALAAAGFNWTADDLALMAADTLKRKNDFKVCEGFVMENVRMPRRILETPSPLGKIDEAFMREAISKFSSGL